MPAKQILIFIFAGKGDNEKRNWRSEGRTGEGANEA